VIISNDWVAPKGPSWESFTIRWPEGRTDGLVEALQDADRRWPAMSAAASEAHDSFFAGNGLLSPVWSTLCGELRNEDALHEFRPPRTYTHRNAWQRAPTSLRSRDYRACSKDREKESLVARDGEKCLTALSHGRRSPAHGEWPRTPSGIRGHRPPAASTPASTDRHRLTQGGSPTPQFGEDLWLGRLLPRTGIRLLRRCRSVRSLRRIEHALALSTRMARVEHRAESDALNRFKRFRARDDNLPIAIAEEGGDVEFISSGSFSGLDASDYLWSRESNRRLTVPAKRLSDVLDQFRPTGAIDLLDVDCEGHELAGSALERRQAIPASHRALPNVMTRLPMTLQAS